MPSITEINMTDLAQLSKVADTEYLARMMDIANRQAYYMGDQKKWLVDPKTKKPKPENITVNVAQKIVDQSVSMLFGGAPMITAETEAQNALIEALTDYNSDDVFFHSIAAAGSIGGHVYVKLIDEPDGVRWVSLNPALVSVFWRWDDAKRAAAYKIQWVEGTTDYRQDIIALDESWLVRDLKREKSADWTITNEETWAYPFAPIVEWQNLPNYLGYYGVSDLTALPINDAINFTASNINSILKNHAHPQTIGTGVRVDQVKETAVEGFWAIESESAKVYNLEMQSDLQSSMDFLGFLRAEFFSQQRAVDVSNLKDKIGQLTNFGLRVMFSDAMQKNATKQLLYGWGLKEIMYRSLALKGVTIDPRSINVDFVDPLPVNDLEGANRIKTEIESGIISKQTGSEELGYDWLEEAARMAAEKQTSQTDLGASLLAAMRGFETQDEGGDVGTVNESDNA